MFNRRPLRVTRHGWHSMKTAMSTQPHSHSMSRSLAANLIFLAMLVAALSLWTALPLTWVYIGSKVSKTQFPAEAPYAVVIIGLITSIILVAWLLGRLNQLYIQITGTNRLAPMRPAWMRSMRDTPPSSAPPPSSRRSSWARCCSPRSRSASGSSCSPARRSPTASSRVTKSEHHYLILCERRPVGGAAPAPDAKQRSRRNIQTTKRPFSWRSSPSTSIRPPRRRSQTRSVWTADSFSPPVSG